MAGIGELLGNRAIVQQLQLDNLRRQIAVAAPRPGQNLDGLSMAGAVRDDSVTLTSISLPNKDLLSGTAGYSLNDKQPWEAHLQGQALAVQIDCRDGAGFRIQHSRRQRQHHSRQLHAEKPGCSGEPNAVYTFGKPKPLALNLAIVNAPPRDIPVALAANTQAKVFNGTINGHFRVEGTLDPVKLDVGGELDGHEVDIRGHHLGEIQLEIAKESHIDPNGVYIYTNALSLFGGEWDLDGVYVPDWNDLTVNVEMKGIDLKQVAAFAGRENMAGTFDGQLRVSVPGLNFAPGNIVVPPASFTVKNLNVDNVLVDKIDATLWMQHGHFEINPIHLTRSDGAGDVSVAMDLADFRKVDVKAKISDWPIDIEGAEAHISASVEIPDALIELPNPKAWDPEKQRLHITAPQIGFSGTTTLNGKKVGDFVAYAGMSGHEFDVRGIHMKLFGGRLDGQAHANLDQLLSSTAEFTWQNLETSQLALIFPQVSEMSGSLTGGLRIAPDQRIAPARAAGGRADHATEPRRVAHAADQGSSTGRIRRPQRAGFWRRMAHGHGRQQARPQLYPPRRRNRGTVGPNHVRRTRHQQPGANLLS